MTNAGSPATPWTFATLRVHTDRGETQGLIQAAFEHGLQTPDGEIALGSMLAELPTP